MSGVAATNATLAWLGGGSLATGGLGMAGGAIVLGSVVAAPAIFICGFAIAGEGADVDSYLQLPENDRSVDGNIYREIFNYDWPWYKSLCKDDGYWDLLDPVREVLSQNIQGFQESSFIFCDEAQDFTRLEL